MDLRKVNDFIEKYLKIKQKEFVLIMCICLGILIIYSTITALFENKIKNNYTNLNIEKTNENMPYILSNEDMPFYISNFNDNQHKLKFQKGIVIFPDKGIIILKMPENIKIIVKQEGMK